MATFNEIRSEAETTREETYGLRVGSNRYGYDAVIWGDKVKGVDADAETAHAKLKREKAENVELYRKQVEAETDIKYNGHRDEVAQHKAEMAMVTGMLRAGLIELDDLEIE